MRCEALEQLREGGRGFQAEDKYKVQTEKNESGNGKCQHID
jgi:hypothetical protein